MVGGRQKLCGIQSVGTTAVTWASVWGKGKEGSLDFLQLHSGCRVGWKEGGGSVGATAAAQQTTPLTSSYCQVPAHAHPSPI